MRPAPTPHRARGRAVIGLALGMALAGCAPVLGGPPPPPVMSPGAKLPAAATANPSQRFVSFIGARQQHAAPFLGVAGTNFFVLRSLLDRQTGQAVHQLYVSDSYVGPERFWQAAYDGRGNPLRFVSIDRREITCANGCSYDEDFAAVIPESELRASPNGLVATFAARNGNTKRIMLSGAAIAAQLAAFDAARATLSRSPK